MSAKQLFKLGIYFVVALFLGTFSLSRSVDAAPEVVCTSVNSGTWNSLTRWDCGHVPSPTDTVVISAPHTVTVNINTTAILGLTVNGILNIGNNNTSRIVTVNGPVTINAGGTVQVPTGSNTTHSLVIAGNFINNGTLNARPDANSLINTTFNGTANQTVSGTGATNNFNLITINNTGAANNNIVEVTATNFAPANGFLTLTDGVLKLSGSYTLSNNIFPVAGYTIPAAGGLWLNNSNVTVTAQNTDINLNGLLQITAGNYNIGTGNNDDLHYISGAVFIMEGGALNISGIFRGNPAGTSTINFTMSGGTITLPTAGNTQMSVGSFDIADAGSSFTMSGGTIIIREGNTGTPTYDYRNIASTVNITGGTVRFGENSSASGETYVVGGAGGTTSLPNVVLNQTNPPSVMLNRPAIINGSLTINTGSTFNANGQDINIAGNWTKNGTFTSGTQTTTFNGTSPQTISGSSATGFSTLVINSGATVIIPATNMPTVAGTMTNNGTLQQTRTVNNANVPFLTIGTDRYRGVDIDTTTSGANLGAVTVTIRGNSGATCTTTGGSSPAYALRCYDITPTTQGAARVTLWALASEQNGVPLANLAPYRNNGSWTILTAITNGTGSNGYVYGQGNTTGFSSFLLGDSANAPTAVSLTHTAATAATPWLLTILIASILLLSGWQWHERRVSLPVNK